MAEPNHCPNCAAKDAQIRQLVQGLDEARQALEVRRADETAVRAEARTEAVERLHLLLVRSLIQR